MSITLNVIDRNPLLNEENKNIEKCSICLEDLSPIVQPILRTACNHPFHTRCLRNWVISAPEDVPNPPNDHCPNCRALLDEKTREDLGAEPLAAAGPIMSHRARCLVTLCISAVGVGLVAAGIYIAKAVNL